VVLTGSVGLLLTRSGEGFSFALRPGWRVSFRSECWPPAGVGPPPTFTGWGEVDICVVVEEVHVGHEGLVTKLVCVTAGTLQSLQVLHEVHDEQAGCNVTCCTPQVEHDGA
jgi:hypothetical protein